MDITLDDGSQLIEIDPAADGSYEIARVLATHLVRRTNDLLTRGAVMCFDNTISGGAAREGHFTIRGVTYLVFVDWTESVGNISYFGGGIERRNHSDGSEDTDFTSYVVGLSDTQYTRLLLSRTDSLVHPRAAVRLYHEALSAL